MGEAYNWVVSICLKNELRGNHVSAFESRRGDEVAFNEGHISLQFRLEDRAEDMTNFQRSIRKNKRFGNTRFQDSPAAGSKIGISTYGKNRTNNGTRQRLAVNPNQKRMVETKRNEAINQIAVGGNVWATKPAAANPASWKQYRDTKRRNLIVTLQVKHQSTEEHLTARGGERLRLPTAGGNRNRAVKKQIFRITDQILTPIIIAVGAGVWKYVCVYALSKHCLDSSHRHCRRKRPV